MNEGFDGRLACLKGSLEGLRYNVAVHQERIEAIENEMAYLKGLNAAAR